MKNVLKVEIGIIVLTNGYTLYILTTKVYPLYILWRRMHMNMTMEKTKRGYVTQTIIKKWGNSQGIRLSKELLSQMDLKENDTIGININNGQMIIEKVNNQKYLNLKERLEAFYKKPIDKIYVESTTEVDVGVPVGEENW